jgi:hypothetical protein
MTALPPEQLERLARACWDAAAAMVALGEALAGPDVMAEIEAEGAAPEEREVTRALTGECGLPIEECRREHDHATWGDS